MSIPRNGETHQQSRGTSLNPNAPVFLPLSLRSSVSSLSNVSLRLPSSANSTISSSLEEYQLPDDITPEFKVLGDDAPRASVGSLSLSGLSLHSNADKMGYPLSLYGDDPFCASYLYPTRNPCNFGIHKDGSSYDETAVPASPTALVGNQDMNHVDLLASQFTGFAVDSLAEVYFANGCDLNLTIEMLTQLELQFNGCLNQNVISKTLSAPNLTSTAFPAPLVPDSKSNLRKCTGDEIHQSTNTFGLSDNGNMHLFKTSSWLASKGGTVYASADRKLASQESGIWKYDRNGLTDVAIGSSRSSHALTGSHNPAASRSSYTERIQGRGSTRPAPVWLETGDAVAHLYSELREEARDHARIRNAYFEQARQAYLVGNKALAKELSVNGQLHNMQMKAAHNKAQEFIYRQRNPISPGLQGDGRCQERLIDLHGLHVSEAILVLKQELGVLRSAARSVDQRLHVYICVGTGHHIGGSRTPARLPIPVKRYLLEEEGLEYSEPQPGLLHVVLY